MIHFLPVELRCRRLLGSWVAAGGDGRRREGLTRGDGEEAGALAPALGGGGNGTVAAGGVGGTCDTGWDSWEGHGAGLSRASGLRHCAWALAASATGWDSDSHGWCGDSDGGLSSAVAGAGARGSRNRGSRAGLRWATGGTRST